MSDWVPTETEIKTTYMLGVHGINPAVTTSDTSDEFDRWLEQHDREVAAKALRDFADAHLDPDNWVLFSIDDAPVTIGDMICEAALRIKEGDPQ